jgi:hypothetical protein
MYLAAKEIVEYRQYLPLGWVEKYPDMGKWLRVYY